jgi:7,8-dihydroneopterin aldolase/epimerase/oxygenase
MLTIQLHHLAFHAHHGVHEEEKLTGNAFDVNVDVAWDEKKIKFNSISQTIDYVQLYDIVKSRMKRPTPLMEKICKDIIAEIKKSFPEVLEVKVSINKLNAPIENFRGSVGIAMQKTFRR